MFHVERNLKSLMYKGMIVFLVAFILNGCGIAKQNIQIPDYILVPNGKEIIGNIKLTAFIFENNRRDLPIEQFISKKLNTGNMTDQEFSIRIDNEKYRLIIYDHAEFEKYFNSSNYAVIKLEPENIKTDDVREFIAISMVNSYNEDCLANNSLFQNRALNYLKNLKDEYYNQ